MPFNFIDNKRYSIDYIQLFEFLNTYRFIRNTNIQRTFLEHWIAALWEVDNKLEFDLPTTRHIYQHPIYYGDIEFYIHFDVTNLISLQKKSNKVPLDLFTSKESTILFDKNMQSLRNDSNEHIILCEFPRSDTSFIVLSGHDKLNNAIKNNVTSVEVIYIYTNDMIQNNSFCSPFDKYYYQFTLELHQVFKKYGKLKFNELHLLKSSFLNQTEHKFLE